MNQLIFLESKSILFFVIIEYQLGCKIFQNPGLVGKTAAMRADGGRIESLLGNVKLKI